MVERYSQVSLIELDSQVVNSMCCYLQLEVAEQLIDYFDKYQRLSWPLSTMGLEAVQEVMIGWFYFQAH
jgi:hypothetical protein